MSRPVVTVTVTRYRGRDPIDSDLPVGSLEDLYEICRKVGGSESLKVSLKGEEGEVRLSFAAFIRTPSSAKP